jgi:hypothetical protein
VVAKNKQGVEDVADGALVLVPHIDLVPDGDGEFVVGDCGEEGAEEIYAQQTKKRAF